jgi:hypothetical protein
MLRSVLTDALIHFGGRNDNSISCHDGASCASNAALQPDDDSTISSVLSESTPNRIADLLSTICTEVNASPEFINLVGTHLLRVDVKRCCDRAAQLETKLEEQKLQGLIDFMALAFQKCTNHCDIVVFALDDAHLTDKLSWAVLQRLFETVPSMLIICTSRPLPSYKLLVDDEFWNILQSRHVHDERFVRMEIGHLCEDETRTLISKTLNIEENDVSKEIRHAVFTQSGGMPQYANEILQSLKKHFASRRRASICLSGQVRSSFGKKHLHNRFWSFHYFHFYRSEPDLAAVSSALSLDKCL